jgi:hypothetical protein
LEIYSEENPRSETDENNNVSKEINLDEIAELQNTKPSKKEKSRQE